MSPALIIFLVSLGVCLVTSLLILVRAFRTSIGWGLIAMLVPFGRIVFVLTHWSEAGGLFVVNVLSIVVAAGLVLGTSLGDDLREAKNKNSTESSAPAARPPPSREARDLVENETPPVRSIPTRPKPGTPRK